MQIKESVLDSIRSRPRFKIYTAISREQYTQLLKDFLAQQNREFSGNVNLETATIRVKNENNAFWKPCLALRTEHDAEKKRTVVSGVFGPTPAVWTFFMFLYFIFGILWMVFFTLWYVEKQIKSDNFPWALSVSFIMLGCIVAIYTSARIGRARARKELARLRQFAEESIRAFEHHAAEEEVSAER